MRVTGHQCTSFRVAESTVLLGMEGRDAELFMLSEDAELSLISDVECILQSLSDNEAEWLMQPHDARLSATKERDAELSSCCDKAVLLRGIEDGRVVFSVMDKRLSLQSYEPKCVFKLERDCSIGVASLLKVSPDVVWLSPSELSRGVFHVESDINWKIF